ncbi:MAG: hypothetical protein RLZZ628_706 [Bacteroidota bacterium]|jgi:hypothetical protein
MPLLYQIIKKKITRPIGIIISLCLGLPFCLIHCSKPSPKTVLPAFYYWKTVFPTAGLSNFEKNVLKNLDNRKIYIKLFDVDWDEATHFPKPVGELSGYKPNDSLIPQIVPTIFITNRTFLQTPKAALDTLATLVLQQIDLKLSNAPFKEIQLDCDWNESSKTNYFEFLKLIHTKLSKNIQLSATIRLHQIKFYEKTGVPPVDRGMLMCYNVSDLDAPQSVNSVSEPAALKSYLKNARAYPLSLDIALPIFAWGVVLRNAQAVKLIHPLRLDDADLNNNTVFLKKSAYNFEILQNTYFKGHYLYKDDIIRIEEVPLQTLRETTKLLKPLLEKQHQDTLTVAFFHLDSTNLRAYRYEDLQNILFDLR